MRIAVLNVNNVKSKSVISEFEPFADPTPYIEEYFWKRYYISKNESEKEINEIIHEDFDVLINLCDGAEGENRPGIEVVRQLEKNKQFFTGASSGFYDPTREEMKYVCRNNSINYPKSHTVKSIYEIDKIKSLNFPYIVKHPNSFNSVGLTKKSVVYNISDLKTQASVMIGNYKGAMIEEYIEGREFTALVVENPEDKYNPIVYKPMEIVFPEGETFKYFDLKWMNHVSMKYIPVIEKTVSEEIKKMSASMFLAMNGSGYARCDLRMSFTNEIFMLEINPNCSIYFPRNNPSSADEILFAETNGHKHFTDLIIKSALNRYRKE